MARNEVVLTGTLVERDEPRLTPSGLPALNFRIGHASEQLEAGMSRKVSLEMDGVALGEVAERLGKLAPGVECRFAGFLAQKSRLSRHNVLHVTNIELI